MVEPGRMGVLFIRGADKLLKKRVAAMLSRDQFFGNGGQPPPNTRHLETNRDEVRQGEIKGDEAMG